MNPTHLATMVINQAGANAYSSSVRQNGAMELRFLAWAFMEAGTPPASNTDPERAAAFANVSSAEWLGKLPLRPGLTPLARVPSIERWALDIYTRGDFDEFWEQPGFNFAKYWDRHADIPMLLCGAWYDSYTRATIENFVGLTERKRGPIHLLMGPWTHGGQSVDLTYSGDVEFGPVGSVAGNLANDFTHLHLHWFDHWLKGIDNGVDQEDPVRYFMMGTGDGSRSREGRLYRGGEWRTAREFPLPNAAAIPYYLRAGGTLSTDKPREREASTTFRYDPHNPVPTIGGNISSLADAYPVPEEIAQKITFEQRWGAIVRVGGQDQRTRPDTLGAEPPFMPLSARQDILVFQT
ncbi:MAG: CocE/NonD family hydrolase, partial [Planctomycetaceae bacterium]